MISTYSILGTPIGQYMWLKVASSVLMNPIWRPYVLVVASDRDGIGVFTGLGVGTA